MASSTTTTTKRGDLQIGDQWNAITIIARSQTHPLKAMCELIENAIDAQATDVHIIRRRKKGKPYLEIWDDGTGIVVDDDGQPDFARIATHICDSMKRHLTDDERAGVHGEFGIGLLSFWSLSEELRMASAATDGRLHEMRLQRGKQSYTVQAVRGELPIGGTRVVIGPLLDSTRTIVTGEKLQRYLAVELRDRIRSTGVRVRITDRISRKQIVVTPREFEGDRLDVRGRLETPDGDLRIELYIRSTPVENEGGVAVCKDGTRVLRDVTELPYFQLPPWTDRRLEGVLDFPTLNLAPGTRSGIVPDERLQAFTDCIGSISSEVQSAIEIWDQSETDKASGQILKKVHRAFVHALRELPANEYLFFDLPRPSSGLQKGNGNFGQEQQGLPVGQPRESEQKSDASKELLLLPPEPGPLESVLIRPVSARRQIGDTCKLTAVARDGQGTVIPDGVEFLWQHQNDVGTFHPDGNQCKVTSQQPGQVDVRVVATQAEKQVSADVNVKFIEQLTHEDTDQFKGLPSYRLEAARGAAWRSRYNMKANEIVINSAHRDFLACKQTAAKHRRYIGKLYAKEVVLINFPHENSSEVMDRLIEVLVRIEDSL